MRLPMPWRIQLRLVLACALLAFGRGAGAVTLGQVDDFEDGTNLQWSVGSLLHPAPPRNVASGGPGGADDSYLLLTAVGGAHEGSRLAAIRRGPWAGDYITAGVTGIAMDVHNFGATSLSLRLAFASATLAVISTLAIELPAASGWTTIVFPVTPADLTALTGPPAQVLARVGELRLYHSPLTTFPGPPLVASLGVDDVRAVPEPSTAFLLGLGLIALARVRRRV
jgi:hypothetical protein